MVNDHVTISILQKYVVYIVIYSTNHIKNNSSKKIFPREIFSFNLNDKVTHNEIITSMYRSRC